MALDLGYPAPRDRGPGAAAVAAGPLPANPTVRLWPFAFREVSGVAVLVSPQFSAPAIIVEAVFQFDVGIPARFPTWSLYAASDNGGGGNNQAIGTVPSGTRLVENLTLGRDDAFTATDFLGVPAFTIAGTTGFQTWPLRLLVALPTFFLKLRLANDDVASFAAQGYLRVLEAVPPEQVPNFL